MELYFRLIVLHDQAIRLLRVNAIIYIYIYIYKHKVISCDIEGWEQP